MEEGAASISGGVKVEASSGRGWKHRLYIAEIEIHSGSQGSVKPVSNGK